MTPLRLAALAFPAALSLACPATSGTRAGAAGVATDTGTSAADAAAPADAGVTDAAAMPDAAAPDAFQPAPGFADVHVHQLAEFGFAGAWYWGQHAGPEDEAMAACSGGSILGGDHARTVLGPLNEFLGKISGSEGDTGLHEFKKTGHPGYEGWPRWDTIAHQQVWEGHLRQAHDGGLSLYVMSAVNFEPLCKLMPSGNRTPGRTCDDMEAVNLQLAAAWDFDRARDWVEIALTPADARRIAAEGKLAMVLSIEVSNLFGAGDWRTQLDEVWLMGVRSLQIAHQLDNRFSGVAPHHWIFKVFEFLDDASGFELDGDGHNLKGLTDEGRDFVAAVMDRGMVLDVAHVSERGVRDIETLAVARGWYPVFMSHGHFRSIMTDDKQREEKTTPDWIVQLIRQTGGMVGLRTGPEQVKSYDRAVIPNNCDGSIRSFAQAYGYGALGLKVPIAFASDFNGFIQQLRPRFGNADETCAGSGDAARRDAQQALQGEPPGSPLDHDGFAHIGLEPDILRELRAQGVDTSGLERSTESFIRVWERCLDPARAGPLPADDVDLGGIGP